MEKHDYTINLVVGDWSRDGHNQFDNVSINSNVDVKAIEKAYAKGTKIVGFDWSKEVAAKYEDNVIDAQKIETLKKFNHPGLYNEEDDGSAKLYDPDEFAQTYMFIACLGDPSIVWSFVEMTKHQIKIGGYGIYLF